MKGGDIMFPKPKKVVLRGKAKKELRAAIMERDGHKCVICGRPATDHHHQPFGANKSDELEKGVALCRQCHQTLHFSGKFGLAYQKRVDDYLRGLYGKNQRN